MRSVIPLMDSGWRNLLRRVPNGAVLYFPGLEGGGSTVIDYSGNGNHGTITGATWGREPSGIYVPDFDGTDDYVVTAASSIFAITEAITMLIWVKPDISTAAIKNPFQLGTAGLDGCTINLDQDGAGVGTAGWAGAWIYNGAWVSAAKAAMITAGKWVRLGLTYDKINLRLWVNGVNQASTATVASITQVASPVVRLGTDPTGLGDFDGKSVLSTIIPAVSSQGFMENDFQSTRHLLGV